MSITKRQFDLLHAMGITVWQRRDLPAHVYPSASTSDESTIGTDEAKNKQVPANNEELTQSLAATEIISIDLQGLLNQQLFKDVIQCLGVSRADLSVQNNQIDLGLINWQFNQNKQIEFSHNCLKTPDLNTIANSVELKKALWQSIGPLSST
jgi:DNA polymerase III psi subunit